MILVTGGAGYIGSHFVKAYLDSSPEARIVVLDNLSTGHVEALAIHGNRVQFCQADLCDTTALHQLFSKNEITAVVHFAASCYVYESELTPLAYFENNVANSIKLFDAMESHGVRKIVFASSCATYGQLRFAPITESHPQDPINVYGLTKLMVEQVLRSLARRSNWSAIALRYFNVAGASDSTLIGESREIETHVIPNLLKTARGENEVFELYGDDYDTADGTCVRDYVHVDDLAEGHLQALAKLDAFTGFEAVNLGSGTGFSVRQLVDLAQSVSGKQIPVRVCNRRDGDPPQLFTTISHAKDFLDWTPVLMLSAWRWETNRRF